MEKKCYRYAITKVATHKNEEGKVERQQVYTDGGILEVNNFENALSHVNARVANFPGEVVEFNLDLIK